MFLFTIGFFVTIRLSVNFNTKMVVESCFRFMEKFQLHQLFVKIFDIVALRVVVESCLV